MKSEIYYFDYADKEFPRSIRKMIIGYKRADLLTKIEELNIPDDWFCWLYEYKLRKPIFHGNKINACEWIAINIPEKFGDPYGAKRIL